MILFAGYVRGAGWGMMLSIDGGNVEYYRGGWGSWWVSVSEKIIELSLFLLSVFISVVYLRVCVCRPLFWNQEKSTNCSGCGI